MPWPSKDDGVETDPWFVLTFCEAAIRDAIYLDDGLDGAAGEAVLTMIDNAKAARPPRSPETAPTPCVNCGHVEADHDGYGGMCDGLGWNAAREICSCIAFAPLTEDVPSTNFGRKPGWITLQCPHCSRLNDFAPSQKLPRLCGNCHCIIKGSSPEDAPPEPTFREAQIRALAARLPELLDADRLRKAETKNANYLAGQLAASSSEVKRLTEELAALTISNRELIRSGFDADKKVAATLFTSLRSAVQALPIEHASRLMEGNGLPLSLIDREDVLDLLRSEP